VNVLQHAVDIPKDIVVPVTQDSIAVRFENARALCIRSRLRCVLAPVNLDNYPLGMAGEIDDVATNPNLTAEMRACDSKAMTQVPPQFALGFRGSASHLPRQLALRRRLRAITLCPDSRFVSRHDLSSSSLPRAQPEALGRAGPEIRASP
jgi:hypothetical protein